MRKALFRVTAYTQGNRHRWRLFIPARFSATGKRRAIYYNTKSDAEKDAHALRNKYAAGEMLISSVLTPDSARDAQAALSTLRTAGLDITLREAAQIAVERNRELLRGIPVSELLKRYADEVSESRAWSTKYRCTWRQYSAKFAAKFGERNVSTLTEHELQEWHASQYSSASYFNSALAVISPAFTWAVNKRILRENPFDRIERRKVQSTEGVDIFTLSECRSLLDAAQANGTLLPFSILLFAGIRPNELTRLTWADIREDADAALFIHIRPTVSKTRSVRLVRIREPLRSLIATELKHSPSGPLVPTGWQRKAKVTRAAAGLQNRADAARHSFASYLLAAGESVDSVRADLGHSKGSDMLFKHYRGIVSPADAAAFWSMTLSDTEPLLPKADSSW